MIEFFTKYDEAQIFDAMVEVFRRRLEESPPHSSIEWRTLVANFGALIQVAWTREEREHGQHLNDHGPQAVFTNDYRKLSSAAWRLVAQNLAYPELGGSGEYRVIKRLTLTQLGRHVCSQRPEEDPSRPGHIERLRQANKDVEDEVFERLLDASACLNASLHRPGVVMIGIAAEVTTIRAYRVMKDKLALFTKTKDVEFKDQIATIVPHIDQVQNLNSDGKHRLKMAFLAIESIRVARNKAAHHGEAAPTPFEANDFLRAACSHFPVVWNVLILPNL